MLERQSERKERAGGNGAINLAMLIPERQVGRRHRGSPPDEALP